MKLSIIAAVAANGVIGNNNQLPWNYPKDMKHFVEITKKVGVVVMGRKTYESIGKPLPNRINIVISRTMESPPGVIVYNNIETVMMLCRYMELNGLIWPPCMHNVEVRGLRGFSRSSPRLPGWSYLTAIALPTDAPLVFHSM